MAEFSALAESSANSVKTAGCEYNGKLEAPIVTGMSFVLARLIDRFAPHRFAIDFHSHRPSTSSSLNRLLQLVVWFGDL